MLNGSFPPPWEKLTLVKICQIQSGAGFPIKYQGLASGAFPFAKVADISEAVLNSNGLLSKAKNYVSHKVSHLLRAKVFPPNSTVFAKIGEAVRLNRRAYVVTPLLADNNVMGVIPNEDVVDPKMLFYFMLTLDIYKMSRATTVPSVRKSDLEAVELGLPPLPEQRQIVAKIEELFSQLDAGVAALKRAQAKLKRYKVSVLKAACEGRLVPTEAELARKEGREYEPASVLLEQIGKQQTTVVEEPFELPEGWAWARLGAICDSIKNGIYKKKEFYAEDGVACLRMYNIYDGAIVWKKIKRMKLNKDEARDYGLHPSDILMNRVNSRELVGKSAVIPANIEQPLVYESKNMRLRFKQGHVNSNFVNYWLSLFSQSFFNTNAQQVVGMASINQTQVARMPIPIAPTEEQKRIVWEVERRLSIIEKLSGDLDTQLVSMGKIRNSILKIAFEGKLSLNSGGEDE